jgi:hypothetical protein
VDNGGINMAEQRSEDNWTELITIFEKKGNKITESEAKNFKKCRVQISMIKPFETVDFWVGKPDENSVLELFMHELFSIDPTKYFKIQISEV